MHALGRTEHGGRASEPAWMDSGFLARSVGPEARGVIWLEYVHTERQALGATACEQQRHRQLSRRGCPTPGERVGARERCDQEHAERTHDGRCGEAPHDDRCSLVPQRSRQAMVCDAQAVVFQ